MNPDEIILTTNNEIMTFEECQKYHETVKRKANKKEIKEYLEEVKYWSKFQNEYNY